MQRNIFSPRVQGADADFLSSFFKRGAQLILVFALTLIPLWFVPGLIVPLGLVKTAIVILGLYVAIIAFSLSLLRSGRTQLYLPLSLIFFWLFTVSTIVSALLSGDVFDSIFGNDFGVFTAGFTIVLAIIMTACLSFVKNKIAITKVLFVILAVVFGVYIFTALRFIWGSGFLDFSVFTDKTATVIGSLNDLALYAGLVLIVVLVAIYRVPTNIIARALALIIVLASLLILAVVNFSFLWLIICPLSLITFFYLIARDTWLAKREESDSAVSGFALTVVSLIFIVSGSFIMGGNYFGSRLATLTGITYLEVRPSFPATIEIAKEVYKENVLTGEGTNRFEDAWRKYKSPFINETVFWNTNFSTGNSYILTMAINTGILGLVFLGCFLINFLYAGYRIIFSHRVSDKGWHTVGLIVVSAALYLWVVTFWYTPNTTIMLLLALFTGLTIVVAQTLFVERPIIVDVTSSRPKGFALIASVIIIVIVSTTTFISFNKYFWAQVALVKGHSDFTKTADGKVYDSILSSVAESLPLQDNYLTEKAKLRLAELSRLISLGDPTEEDKQTFENILVEGVKLSEQAISLDYTNPVNHALLGSFYGFLDSKQYEGVAQKRDDAFAIAKKYDPLNPEYDLLEAQILTRFGETEEARDRLTSAIALKKNYTDALFLLSQLDIQSGNATSALATTRAIIKIEPDNPARYFQLGLLLFSLSNFAEATTAFEQAINLDQEYANARYLLALTYLNLNHFDDALIQLKIVRNTNEDNKSLQDLISQIESGNYSTPDLKSITPVSDQQEMTGLDNQTVVTKKPETHLVAPVNRIPETVVQESFESVENSTNTPSGVN